MLVLFFSACLKTDFCSLCTSMFVLGTIMIWQFLDLVLIVLSFSLGHDCKKGSHSSHRMTVFRVNRELQGCLTIGTAL